LNLHREHLLLVRVTITASAASNGKKRVTPLNADARFLPLGVAGRSDEFPSLLGAFVNELFDLARCDYSISERDRSSAMQFTNLISKRRFPRF
jgi:hypothetical protein